MFIQAQLKQYHTFWEIVFGFDELLNICLNLQGREDVKINLRFYSFNSHIHFLLNYTIMKKLVFRTNFKVKDNTKVTNRLRSGAHMTLELELGTRSNKHDHIDFDW